MLAAQAPLPENVHQLRELAAQPDMPYLDDLTGAFRPEIGWHALDREVNRSHRGDGRFVLASVDVDGLKRVNDRAGRDMGDQVLRSLVATMRSSLRSSDPIVRIGGGGFACGLAGVDQDEADRRFGEIERSLYADTGVVLSVATAVLADGETLGQILERADAALVDVKRSHAPPAW
jgi:diguanylate cyclase (GGDEF)-like protein